MTNLLDFHSIFSPSQEIMDPTSVGIPKSSLVLGKHSGRHAFRDRVVSLQPHLAVKPNNRPPVDVLCLNDQGTPATPCDQHLLALRRVMVLQRVSAIGEEGELVRVGRVAVAVVVQLREEFRRCQKHRLPSFRSPTSTSAGSAHGPRAP